MKREIKIAVLYSLIGLMVTAVTPLYAQIGGNLRPLQYSVHTYSIQMGDFNYTPVWGVYYSGVTTDQIEDGSATALLPGIDYIVASPVWKNAGNAYFKIQFMKGDLTPTPSADYVIGYKEVTNDGNLCVTAVILGIHLWGTFDVDVTLNDNPADCPDDSNVLKQPGDHLFQTTVQYLVNIDYPGVAEGGYENVLFPWRFDFEVKIVGTAPGASATIASITATAADVGFVTQTWGAAVGSSDFTNSCSVTPSSVSPVIFTVVYNDVLGVKQDISFILTQIQGAFGEPDVMAAGDNLTHTIYSMPNVGDILAWN